MIGADREKERKTYINLHPHGQWGHLLSEVMWEGLDTVDKLQGMYLSVEQIPDLCLKISEVEIILLGTDFGQCGKYLKLG